MSKFELNADTEIKLDPMSTTITAGELLTWLETIRTCPHNVIHCSYGHPHKYNWFDRVIAYDDVMLLCQKPTLKQHPDKMPYILQTLQVIEDAHPKESMRVFHVKLAGMVYRPILGFSEIPKDPTAYSFPKTTDKLIILGDSLGDLGYFE